MHCEIVCVSQDLYAGCESFQSVCRNFVEIYGTFSRVACIKNLAM